MKIEGEELNAALAKLLLEAITPETRNGIFAEALKQHVFAPTKDSYGTQHPSLFSKTVKEALEGAVRRVAADFVAQPEQMEKIRDQVKQAFDAMLANGQLAAAVLARMTRAIENWH